MLLPLPVYPARSCVLLSAGLHRLIFCTVFSRPTPPFRLLGKIKNAVEFPAPPHFIYVFFYIKKLNAIEFIQLFSHLILKLCFPIFRIQIYGRNSSLSSYFKISAYKYKSDILLNESRWKSYTVIRFLSKSTIQYSLTPAVLYLSIFL